MRSHTSARRAARFTSMGRTARVAAAGCALIVWFAGTSTAKETPTAFKQDGWTYKLFRLGRVSNRYRLRVMAVRPGAASNTGASEFRLLLDWRGPKDFLCLRWTAGRVDLIRVKGGRVTPLAGRTSAALAPSAGKDGARVTVEVDRSPRVWAVRAGGREIITAADPNGGAAAPAQFAWAARGGWKLQRPTLQRIEPIHFEDDCERETPDDPGMFQIVSGTWRVDQPDDTERSVNTFRLRGESTREEGGKRTPALALFGYPFWRAYRFEASVRFLRGGAVGLVFGASGSPDQDKAPDHYGLVRWRLSGPGASAPALEVVHVRPPDAAGKGAPAGRLLGRLWTPRRDQWYRVSVALYEEFAELEINGRRAVFPLPPELRSGRCGLWADSDGGVQIDDIKVVSHEGFLHRPGGAITPWVTKKDEPRALYRLPDGNAWLRMGLPSDAGPVALHWRDRVGADVSLRFDRKNGVAEFKRGARAKTLGQIGAFKLDAEGPDEFTVQLAGGHCTVLQGKKRLGHFSLRAPRVGPVRILPEVIRDTDLPLVAGGPLAPRPALRRKSNAFTRVDITIKNGELLPEYKYEDFAAWLEDKGTWEYGDNGLLRCRTTFWGPLAVDADLPLPERDGDVSLLRLVTETKDAAPFTVGVRRVAEGKYEWVDGAGKGRGGFTPRMRKENADEEADKTAAPAPPRVTLSIASGGGALTARVDGKYVFSGGVLADGPVRVEAQAAQVTPADITIRADSVDESLFETSPTEWAVWRGRSGMTQKWACDPRWTFLGVWTDRVEVQSDAAGIFSRAAYFGDQDLQFYFAFKDVLGGVDGRRYVRRDMNWAFACERADLASGYCLMMGGFDNRGTQLLRLGKLVHESDFRIPEYAGSISDIHWEWFRLRITRRGGRIRATLNGEEILAWTDPDPLPGGHVGVWTLGNGIIVGRTRFSAARRGREMPAFREGPSPVPAAGWRALEADRPVAVTPAGVRAFSHPAGASGVIRSPSLVRVINFTGGGRMAVAGTQPAVEAKVLAFRANPGVQVRAYAIPVPSLGAPAPESDYGLRALWDDDKASLPADGKWHWLPLAQPLAADERLVVGNWKTENYAAAGLGANRPGASYEVGLFANESDANVVTLLADVSPNTLAGPASAGLLLPDPGADGEMRAWTALDWGNPVRFIPWMEPGKKNALLGLRLTGGAKDKSAVSAAVKLALPAKGRLVMDVFSGASKPVPVAFAVFTGDKRLYAESPALHAAPGWNRLAFDLGASNYKSEASAWKHAGAIAGREDARELVLLFHTQTPVVMAVDGIRIEGAK